MDVAASEFFENGKYDLNFKQKPNDGTFIKTPDQMIDLYTSFVDHYPIVSIEDPFD